MTRRIDKLYNTLRATENQIAKLRAKCKHKSFRIGWYSWRIGNMDPQRLCNTCDAIVPGLTEKEVAKLKEEHDFLTSTDGIL